MRIHFQNCGRNFWINSLFAVFLINECSFTSQVAAVCDEYLLPGIADNKITASTEYSSQYPSHNARLSSNNGWAAKGSDQNPWIQAEFDKEISFVAIVTKGMKTHDEWVESYKVSHSNTGSSWEDVKVSGSVKIFPGNTDRNTLIRNDMPSTITAKYVRILPQTWHDYSSLRFDVIGCVYEETTVPTTTTTISTTTTTIPTTSTTVPTTTTTIPTTTTMQSTSSTTTVSTTQTTGGVTTLTPETTSQTTTISSTSTGPSTVSSTLQSTKVSETFTTPQTTATNQYTSSVCKCEGSCYGSVIFTDLEIQQKIDIIKKKLTVPKTETSQAKRSKISVFENRTSAKSIGYVGAIFLATVVIFFVLSDLIAVVQFFLHVFKLWKASNI